MCRTPKMPTAPVQPAAQAEKQPDQMSAYRVGRRRPGAGGTLLTGPSGIERAAMNLGGTTLLGG